MRRALVGILLCSAYAVCGCGLGSGSRPATLPSPQHGGNIVPLPDGKGFAELLIDHGAARTQRKARLAAPVTGRLLVYFYQADGTALTPPPGDVKVRLGSEDHGKDVKLTPQNTAAGQFASEPAQFSDELRGQLELTMGGEALVAKFMFR